MLGFFFKLRLSRGQSSCCNDLATRWDVELAHDSMSIIKTKSGKFIYVNYIWGGSNISNFHIL